MKFNIIKTIIAFSISLLLGLLCYVIAKDVDHRNIISLSIATLTIFACFASAFAIDYNCGNRNVNIKVATWILSIIVVITNFIFSCFMYNIIVYIVIALLLTCINVLLVSSLYKQN